MEDNTWRVRLEGEVADLRLRMNNLEKGAAVDEVHRANVEKRLTAIEMGQVWLIRIIIAAIVGAVMTFILSGGLVGP